MDQFITPAAWLHAVEVWCPFPSVSWERAWSEEECRTAIAEALARNFPPRAFNAATVKLMAGHCETFPNYYWCNRVLQEWLA